MSSDSRRGLRIALCFTVAFVLAELLRIDLQLTFLAPLVAGALAVGPAVGTIRLIVLSIFAWLLVALAGVAMQFLAREPMVLGLLSLWVFFLGFKMFAEPRNATLGLTLLLVFANVPQTLIKGPELSGDLACWFGMNFGIAALCEGVTRRLLPDAAPVEPAFRPPQVPPLMAAAALWLAVTLTAMMHPPAPGAVIVGIIIVLRADGESAAHDPRAPRGRAAGWGHGDHCLGGALAGTDPAGSRHRHPTGGLAVRTPDCVRRPGCWDRHRSRSTCWRS